MRVDLPHVNTQSEFRRMCVLRDTAANIRKLNPMLQDGEMALEVDTGLFKFGDGRHFWVNLAYANMPPSPRSGYYVSKDGQWFPVITKTATITLSNGETETVTILCLSEE